MIRKVMLVSDTPEGHALLASRLAADGVQVVPLSSLRAALLLMRDPENTASAVALDMQRFSPVEPDLLAAISDQHPHVPIMVFTSSASRENLFHRLENCGNISIFATPLAGPDAPAAILQVIAPTGALPVLSVDTDDPPHVDEFLRRVGRSDVPVLLHGETGAGKEVMALKLWAYSNRAGKSFLKVNCAALPTELIERELFGYEKGAFPGALLDKPGKFELAQDGTILLDEIGDMDTRLQAKLLQVLQDGEVQPLGSCRTVNVNVRIMAATHRSLQAAIAQGTFREDLYYRLSVINITIPPLRDRRDEIMPLAERLLLRHVGPGSAPPAIPDGLRRAMLAHTWPGNVRELENVMRRLLVYQDAGMLAAELASAANPSRARLALAKSPLPAREFTAAGPVSFDHFAESSRTAESRLLLETLESVRWNRRQAAQQLNIDYKALLYKLQKHGIVESKAKRREVSA